MKAIEIPVNSLIEWFNHDRRNAEPKQGIVTAVCGSLIYCKERWRQQKSELIVDEVYVTKIIETRPLKEELKTVQTIFGKYANKCGYTDVEPWEVIAEPKPGVKIIRSMICGDSPVNMKELNFEPGGFCGTYTNQHSQRWDIQSDPEGHEQTIRLHSDGDWYSAHRGRFSLSDAPHKFYDYNF